MERCTSIRALLDELHLTAALTWATLLGLLGKRGIIGGVTSPVALLLAHHLELLKRVLTDKFEHSIAGHALCSRGLHLNQAGIDQRAHHREAFTQSNRFRFPANRLKCRKGAPASE